MVSVVAFSDFSSTGYKVQTLAGFDVPTVTDKYGDVYTAVSSSVSSTPDGEPILYVSTGDGGIGYLFVEDIRVIEGECV